MTSLKTPRSGINAIKHCTNLIVHRDFDLYSALKCHYDFEGNVAYSIIDTANGAHNVLWGFGDFYLAPHLCCVFQCCPNDIDLVFIDSNKTQMMNIIKEREGISVYTPISVFIGSIVEKTCFKKFHYEMHVMDNCGAVIFKIPHTEDKSYIYSGALQEVGIIKKVTRSPEVANFLVSFSVALNVYQKALIIGATIYMDQLWGSKNECPKARAPSSKSGPVARSKSPVC